MMYFKSIILITGGAGFIGSNYIKLILRYHPSKIVVVDINENGSTELTKDLRSSNLLDYKPKYITYTVNLLSDTFDKIFRSVSWDVIANFYAHKHVRSEKDKISVEALIKNNVYGAIKLFKKIIFIKSIGLVKHSLIEKTHCKMDKFKLRIIKKIVQLIPERICFSYFSKKTHDV